MAIVQDADGSLLISAYRKTPRSNPTGLGHCITEGSFASHKCWILSPTFPSPNDGSLAFRAGPPAVRSADEVDLSWFCVRSDEDKHVAKETNIAKAKSEETLAWPNVSKQCLSQRLNLNFNIIRPWRIHFAHNIVPKISSPKGTMKPANTGNALS
ncbi:hypothetical protein OPT61_g1355 [Boeremia exigua]|uniref:Uncharacterized protein n=1 Tax=Boeremia exigua TaxID=749465 RepID=A0ACC2IQH6_9PLEO|nr:hypothetical protein OPT61_g1355 [Boeremia exigua]